MVRVVSESGEVLTENPAALAQQAGQSYRGDAVRESLRQLYRSGRYADVRAEAAAGEGGVRLDFVVRQNAYVNSVRVTGLREPPNEGTALAALQLGLGEIFRERALREALERLQEALRDEGFYHAGIAVERKETPATHQMDIRVWVAAGPRARIGVVAEQGEAHSNGNELLRRARLKPGKEVTTARLDRAAERVRKYLAKRGHLSARVAVRRGDYDASSKTLPLTLDVFAGPKVRVELSGAKISDGKLRKLLPIYQEGAVDEDLLQEGRRNIRDHLESRGYFDSQVRYTAGEDAKTGHRVITYTVERGAQRRLVGIEFTGNKYFSTSLLRERLGLQPASLASRGRFSRKLLESDTESIQQMYVANGFRDAQVQWETVEDYQGKKGDLFVRFRVAEGPQTLVAGLKLEGNKTLDNDFLLSVVGSTPGQPFSEFNVAGDRDNILALYYNEGFPEARFEPLAEEGGAPNRMRLTYRIVEGPQFKVKQVLLGGYQNTRENTIAREVQLTPGEPLRQGDIVETQRRLYNLGIFSRVQIAPQNPSGTDTDKTLIVLVEEAKRYTIAYGGGVEVQRLGSGSDPVGGEVRASPRGIFEISKANVLGRAHTLSFKVRASTLQGRALLSYTAPSFLGRPSLSFLQTGFADKTRDVRTFTSTRYEASTQVAQQVSNITTVLYRYAFRRVQVDAASLKVDPLQIPLFSQPTKISSLGISWVRERRDNPTDATRGNFNTADLSVASRALASSASFLRAFVQNSTFHALPRRMSFARSTRIGIQRALGKTMPVDIPLPERFFAGGGMSLRGFALNQAGPRDPKTGFPIGGQAMLLFNQELRFPMRLPLVSGTVGGAIFYDAGNVFRQANRITLAMKPPAPVFSTLTPNVCQLNCTNELRYFSHTIGFGIRYATPIGPVRIDLAYQLNAPQILVPDGAGGQKLSRLPRFHFFFNIGSLF
ncbi:MAG: BamA/TamA family outer membrane protein [Acidobacteria bacterium]|nr:BamA/TamA family outer membrane protein [Acidobacteriota bacterium]MBI3662640.1 BamA/TamA family outer membrane protein [Acidobacteriota bacterium]